MFVLFILLKIGFVLVVFGKLTKLWSFLAGRVDNALHFHFKYVSGRVCLVCRVCLVYLVKNRVCFGKKKNTKS